MTNTDIDELIERSKHRADSCFVRLRMHANRKEPLRAAEMITNQSTQEVLSFCQDFYDMFVALQQTKQEIEKLRGETLCGVCAGDPVAPCICGGTGKAHMEADGLRQELIKAQQELEDEKAAHSYTLSTLESYIGLDKELEEAVEVIEKIDQWAKAYPLDIFPEPDFQKARELLKAGDITLDAISASCMRHVIKGVGEKTDAFLKKMGRE